MQSRAMSEDCTDPLHRAALKTGQVYLGGPLERRDCRVWDRNKSGATIEVASDLMLPREVRLISAALRVDQPCRVAWQNGRKIGLVYAR
jgi:hypothetical protein